MRISCVKYSIRPSFSFQSLLPEETLWLFDMVVASFKETCQSEDMRKLKAHKKSRKGCGNCKLRKIKVRRLKPCFDIVLSLLSVTKDSRTARNASHMALYAAMDLRVLSCNLCSTGVATSPLYNGRSHTIKWCSDLSTVPKSLLVTSTRSPARTWMSCTGSILGPS